MATTVTTATTVTVTMETMDMATMVMVRTGTTQATTDPTTMALTTDMATMDMATMQTMQTMDAVLMPRRLRLESFSPLNGAFGIVKDEDTPEAASSDYGYGSKYFVWLPLGR